MNKSIFSVLVFSVLVAFVQGAFWDPPGIPDHSDYDDFYNNGDGILGSAGLGDGDHGDGMLVAGGAHHGDGDLGSGGLGGSDHGDGILVAGGAHHGDGDLGSDGLGGSDHGDGMLVAGGAHHGDGDLGSGGLGGSDHGDGMLVAGGAHHGDGDLGSGGLGGSDHGDGIFGSGGLGDGTLGSGGTDDHDHDMSGSGDHGIDGHDHSTNHSGFDYSADGSGMDISSGSGMDIASGSGIDGDHDHDDYDHSFIPIMNNGCAKGCAKCFFGMCRKCKKGYKKSMYMTCIKRKPKRKSCRQIPHCKVCTGMIWMKSCKTCEKGWYKHTGEYDFKSRCVKKCPRGYKAQNSKKGAFCKRATPEGCVDYYCTMCKKGWYTVINKGNTECHKQCPAGFYPMTNDHCNRCKRGCTKCSSALKCESCAKRLTLFTRVSWGAVISTRCLARCPRGYKKELVKGKGSVCRQVCFVHNCQRCPNNGHSGLHHHCDSCKPGYHLQHGFRFSDRCVRKCPKGFFAERTHIGTICRIGSQPTAMPTWPEPTSEETTTSPEVTTMKPEPTTKESETTTISDPTATPAEPTSEDKTTAPEVTTMKSESTTTEPETTTITDPTAEVIPADPDFSEAAFADEP